MADDRRNVLKPSETATRIALNEKEQIRKEIVETRDKLGQFSLRDFSEGLFGEEFTNVVYGKTGGQIAMKDVKMSMKGTAEEGVVGLQLDEEQQIAIMSEAHPSLSREQILILLKAPPVENQKLTNQALNEHMDSVDDAVDRAHAAFQVDMLGDLRKKK